MGEPHERWRGPGWPSHPDMLIDTSRCPACFHEISASPCPSCGFDLSDPRTFDVLDLSQRISALVTVRAAALHRIGPAQSDSAGGAAAVRDSSPAAAVAAGAGVAAVPSAPAASAPGSSVPSAPAASAPGSSVPSAPALSAPGSGVETVSSAPASPAAAGTVAPGPDGPAASAAASPIDPSPSDTMESVPATAGVPISENVDADAAVTGPSEGEVSGAWSPPHVVPPVAERRAPHAGVPAAASVGRVSRDAAPSGPVTPRRSGVQVFLLSVGVVLLAVAAAFFLTVAWVSGGIGLRSAIIGLLTAGVITTASLLRRRGLGATAEGIALLGIALVGLDVWAVRANDLFSAGSSDWRVYAGLAATGAGVLFLFWSRVSALRSPFTAGVIALALGPGLVAAGLVPVEMRWYAFGVVPLAVGLAAPLIPRLARPDLPKTTIETTLLRVVSAATAVIATTAAVTVRPDALWMPLILAAPVALALAGHAAMLARQDLRGARADDDVDTSLGAIAGTGAVLVLGVGVAATAARLADATFSATAPLLIGSLVFLMLEASTHRAAPGSARTTLRVATAAAAVGTGAAALLSLVTALAAFAEPVRRLVPIFAGTAVDVVTPGSASTAAVLALAAAVALAGAAWRLTGRAGERRTAFAAAVAVVLVVGGIQSRILIVTVLFYLALAVVAALLLRRRRLPAALTLPTAGVALAVGWVLSFRSPLAWAVATAVVVAIVLLLGPLTRATRAVAAIGPVLFLTASAALLPAALRAETAVDVAGLTPALAAMTMAAACALVPVRPVPGLLDATGRQLATTTALIATGVLAAPLAVVSLTVAESWWLSAAAAAAASVAVASVFVERRWTFARQAAALLFAPLVGVAGSGLTRVVGGGDAARSVLLALVVVVVCATALSALRSDAVVRRLVEGGATVVATASFVVAPGGREWIPTILIAVAVFLAAVDGDGVFTSRGARRHLVWLALVLGTSALWMQLSAESVGTVEAYTLPVAAALGVFAVLAERARRRVPGRGTAAPAGTLFGAFAVALLPAAFADPADTVRATVVGVAAAAVLLAGAWFRPRRTPDALPAAASAAGAMGMVSVLVLRIGEAVRDGRTGSALVDIAVSLGAAVLVAAAVGVARREAPWAAGIARAGVVAGVAAFAVGFSALIAIDGGPLARATVPVVVLGVVMAACALRGSGPFSAPVAATAGAGAAMVAFTGFAVGLRPVEWMTVPLALLLLATAVLAVDDDRSRRRTVLWALGLGVGVLPSALFAATSVPRAAIVATVAAALTLTAARLADRAPRLAPVTVAISASALLLTGVTRALVDLEASFRPTFAFDLWMLLTAAVFIAAGALIARRPSGWPSGAAPGMALVGVGVLTGLTVARLVVGDDGIARATPTMAVILVLGLVWRDRTARVMRWASVGAAVVIAMTTFAVASVDPIEALTAPIAAALLVAGARGLARDTTLRSWPAVGPGLALLLLPSLLFDFSADNTLWRIVALGLVALAALLVGVRWRLQAPVLLGGIVLIVHAVAQLWPWISSVYESVSGLWWLWLGIAGVVLIVLAATYERRIRELRSAALAIRALR